MSSMQKPRWKERGLQIHGVEGGACYVPFDALRFTDACTGQETTDQTEDRNRSLV